MKKIINLYTRAMAFISEFALSLGLIGWTKWLEMGIFLAISILFFLLMYLSVTEHLDFILENLDMQDKSLTGMDTHPTSMRGKRGFFTIAFFVLGTISFFGIFEKNTYNE